jgi:hypothetical protein
MALRSLGLFLVELAAGTSLLLLFFPTRELGKGFFALHGLVSGVALGLAATVAHESEKAVTGIALALTVSFLLLAGGGGLRAARLVLAPASVAQYVWLWRIADEAAADRTGWIFAGAVLGSLLLGSVVLTMNLGHWYLVSRSLPIELLFRAAVGYGIASAARTALLAIVSVSFAGTAGWEALTSPDRDGLFFLFRVLWGIAGPLAMSYFIFQTSRMRANQAATGLLYVALIFVLVGELLSAYLTVRVRFPV